MKRSLLVVLGITTVFFAILAGCHKKSAGDVMASIDAAAAVSAVPVASVDTSAMDAATAPLAADTPDAAPPTQESFEKAATAAISNVQAASNELDKIEHDISGP